MTIRLNIGAGPTEIEGWTPIDRNIGVEAYPLEYDDGSVEEIRASHILEHFSFRDASAALRDWVRVLKPGGRIRIAVPDVDYCLKSDHKHRLFWLMGGQTDDNDFHQSAYDEERLRAVMADAGLAKIKRWESDNTDTAAHPCSLNLEGIKPTQRAVLDETGTVHSVDETNGADRGVVKIMAYMTLPRYEAVAARSIIEGALKEAGIPLATSQGVFWPQCMQKMFENAVEQGCDWILTVDGDSLFNADHVRMLLDDFGTHPEADAMAALQCRRGTPFPLMTQGGKQGVQLDNYDSPIIATTAHFGLTLIRVEDLLDIRKPWFVNLPDVKGEYGDDRLDPDIWFWHQWRLAGKTVYVAPRVRIGHLEEMVAVFDDELQPHHEYLPEWRRQHLNIKESAS